MLSIFFIIFNIPQTGYVVRSKGWQMNCIIYDEKEKCATGENLQFMRSLFTVKTVNVVNFAYKLVLIWTERIFFLNLTHLGSRKPLPAPSNTPLAHPIPRCPLPALLDQCPLTRAFMHYDMMNVFARSTMPVGNLCPFVES